MTTTSSKQQTPIVNALSFDVEEHFQVQAFADQLTQSDWDRHETRVAGNTDRLIDLLGEAGQSATFFTLGWVAQRHPDLVKRIVSHGHELASHGFAHCRVDSQTPEDFRQDVRKTKALLEDAGGVAVVGYRAATFSMGAFTPWAHEILAGEGHRYSSSIYPVKHDLYGAPDAPRFAYCPIPGDTFLEIPITTTRFAGRNFPGGGGGYFRFLPYGLTKHMINRVNRQDGEATIFYMHPWEIDPGQPRITGASLKSRFRHYLNLNKTERRLRRLMTDFSWSRIDRIFLDDLDKAQVA